MRPLVFDAPWAIAAFAATLVGGRVVDRTIGRRRGQREGDRSADLGTSRAIFRRSFLAFGLALGLAFVPHFALPGGAVPVLTGLVLAWLGTSVRVWARVELDRFFQPVVIVQSDHEVVESGPYRLVRHPAYLGSLLIVLGLGLALGSWLSVAALVLLPLSAYLRRIAVEEAELARVLGDRYTVYARRTRRLVPGVW